MTGLEWAAALAGALAAVIAISWFMFGIEILIARRHPKPVLPCVMHPDQWGMYCSTHRVRATSFGTCPNKGTSVVGDR